MFAPRIFLSIFTRSFLFPLFSFRSPFVGSTNRNERSTRSRIASISFEEFKYGFFWVNYNRKGGRDERGKEEKSVGLKYVGDNRASSVDRRKSALESMIR